MSKLSESINPVDTGNRKIMNDSLFNKVVDINHVWERADPSTHSVAKIYRVEARFGAQVVVKDCYEGREAIDSLAQRVHQTRRAVIEAVFGEFRPLMAELSLAISQNDFETASEVYGRIYDQMFT